MGWLGKEEYITARECRVANAKPPFKRQFEQSTDFLILPLTLRFCTDKPNTKSALPCCHHTFGSRVELILYICILKQTAPVRKKGMSRNAELSFVQTLKLRERHDFEFLSISVFTKTGTFGLSFLIHSCPFLQHRIWEDMAEE